MMDGKGMTRRALVAAAAGAVATPSVGQTTGRAPEIDCVIVGAGAAGIAAARALMAARRTVLVLEAAGRTGGRCVTETATFDVPYDRGAHWIHMPDINPVGKLGPGLGFDIYPAPDRQTIRVGRRPAREGEVEAYFAAETSANAAIAAAARKSQDTDARRALPRGLGDWRQTVEFVLGPFGCAKDLADVSVQDYAMSAEREIDAFCRQGFGALLTRLASGLPVRLDSPVDRIDWSRPALVEVSGAFGTVRAAQVIVTASTNLVAAGRIRFQPALPTPMQEAHAKLTLGTYNHIALELEGDPLGLKPDTLVFAKAGDARQGGLLANVSGTKLSMLDVGGSFGRELEQAGAAAMLDFARTWLTEHFGPDAAAAIRRTHATRWGAEPWVQGAYSCAPPGAQPLRRRLMDPVGTRLRFAGEAAHETLWATVAGAWESGERAAGEVLRALPPLRPQAPPQPTPRRT